MKKINDQLSITDIDISYWNGRLMAQVYFLYMGQYSADGIYYANSKNYSSFGTQDLPSSMHDAIEEEVSDSSNKIKNFLNEKFREYEDEEN